MPDLLVCGEKDAAASRVEAEGRSEACKEEATRRRLNAAAADALRRAVVAVARPVGVSAAQRCSRQDDNAGMGDVSGATLSIGFSFGGNGGPALTSAGISPTFNHSAGRPENFVGDAFILAGSGLAGIAMGATARRIRGENVFGPKDLALDGLAGVSLGTCLVSTPQAEAVCTGALSALPLQFINRAIDPRWDWRVGLVTNGVLSLARAELGGNPIPWAGYRTDANGFSRPVTSELVGNALTDIGMDSAFFALSNTSAALIQRRPNIGRFSLAGAGYGGGTSALVNGFLGAPVRISPELRAAAIKNDLTLGGPDVSDVVRFTTFRTGGLFQLAAPGTSITLGRNVGLQGSDITPDILGHELIHRDQIAGIPSPGNPGGVGSLSFYSQYLVWAVRGYDNIPYERDAYHYAQGFGQAADPNEAQYGKLIAAPLTLGLFALPTFTTPPPQ
jgi:hypothetical protein